MSDREQALAILKEVKGLNKFKELAAELTERGNKRMEQGDLGWVERRWFRDIFDVAENLAIGEFGGPVATLSKWSVFYIVDKRSEDLKNYDLVKVQIDNILTRRQKDEAFRLWAEKALETADITIFDDVLLNSIDRSKYPDTTFSSM
ncbi:MAG: peptidylprolyl isomerase [candidate division Zixibacteria bacterium]|nr:peptidylprolyl isomerase [candidate division Zixibacteria bacterium]